jgi:hypothetical protein
MVVTDSAQSCKRMRRSDDAADADALDADMDQSGNHSVASAGVMQLSESQTMADVPVAGSPRNDSCGISESKFALIL